MTARNRRKHSRSHTRRIARTVESQSVQGSLASLEPTRRSSQRPPVPPGEANLERAVRERSSASTRDLTHAGLRFPCPDGHGAYGVYCFPSVRGMCRARLDLGHADLLSRQPMAPGELEPLAAAVRNAQRDARFREQQQRYHDRRRAR